MIEQEEKLKEMLAEVEDSKEKLKAFLDALRSYYNRILDLSIQHRRKQPVTDLSLAEDFKNTVSELRALVDHDDEFWFSARAYFQTQNKSRLVVDNKLLVKQINSSALVFTRQADELFTLFKNIQTAGKEQPLRLNWWVLETCSADLLKITNRILYLIRDLEKNYE